MCRHFFSIPVLDMYRGSYLFGPIKLGQALFFQHCPRHFHNRPILPFGHTVFRRRIPITEFALNSHLLQITVELAGKVLFSAIWLQALDLPLCFPFDKIFRVPKTVENFIILFDEVDPCVPAVIVDEGDKVSTPAKTHVLFGPHTSECIKSSLFRLRLHSLGKGSRCCFPSWQAL